MELLPVVELVTTLVTFMLMASGIPACLHMYRTQRTKNVPFIFFLVNAFNSAFALYYGLLVNNSTFILINAVGIVFWGLYIIIYIRVSTSKSWPLTQLLLLVIVFFGHGVFLKLFTPLPPALTNTLGCFIFAWSVVLLLTPILDVIEIVQQGSSAGSDLFLLFGGTLCCLAWLLYGYLLNDVFVYGPNILGLGVNGIKLAIIAAYRGTKGKLE